MMWYVVNETIDNEMKWNKMKWNWGMNREREEVSIDVWINI